MFVKLTLFLYLNVILTYTSYHNFKRYLDTDKDTDLIDKFLYNFDFNCV